MRMRVFYTFVFVQFVFRMLSMGCDVAMRMFLCEQYIESICCMAATFSVCVCTCYIILRGDFFGTTKDKSL